MPTGHIQLVSETELRKEAEPILPHLGSISLTLLDASGIYIQKYMCTGGYQEAQELGSHLLFPSFLPMWPDTSPGHCSALFLCSYLAPSMPAVKFTDIPGCMQR